MTGEKGSIKNTIGRGPLKARWFPIRGSSEANDDSEEKERNRIRHKSWKRQSGN